MQFLSTVYICRPLMAEDYENHISCMKVRQVRIIYYITNLECHPIDFVIHNMHLKMMHVSAAGLYGSGNGG